MSGRSVKDGLVSFFIIYVVWDNTGNVCPVSLHAVNTDNEPDQC